MKIIAGAACFNMKKLVLWLFVFLPLAAYSQYLEPKDVGILVDNWDIINSTMRQKGEEERPLWEAFDERGSNVISSLERMRYAFDEDPEDDVFEDDSSGFEDFRRCYDEFMNGKLPPSLQRTFESIGWKKRGLQKMFTLIFGMMFIVLDREISEYDDEENTGYGVKALEVIDKSDRKIIEDNMEKIIQLMSN
jgi:hypothetical protein